ncbi:SDR family oxidoreductase [Hoeflea sp. TYP-13]|uniref:SDR family oxidoreductase n=1 Tax=Hoeflea sp. TYP-13 TaxID=3230023 RepID=UPI0034C5D9FB
MRVALTGGATGIGAAVAARLKARGAEVTAFDLNEPQGNVDRWIRTDLGNSASIAEAAAAADGPYDALINNAGLPPKEGMEALILQVNFIGLRTFMNAMLDKLAPGAAIVNTASRAGAMWRDNIAEVKSLMALNSNGDVPEFVGSRGIDHVRAYNLSKEAVVALTTAGTETMIARDLRMNSVSPAAVSTGILDDFLTAFGERARNAVKRAGRAGQPDEIADVICFLASPESRWIKGQDIVIDGGISAMVASDALQLEPS